MKAAFNALPAELGRAAVKAAGKRRQALLARPPSLADMSLPNGRSSWCFLGI
jgi:hypothetical protein